MFLSVLSLGTRDPMAGKRLRPRPADRARGLRDARRLPAGAPDPDRRLHALRPLPRRLPRHRRRASRCRRATSCSTCARAAASAACSQLHSRRPRRSRRDDLVVHAVQRVRRGVPGRHRAGADHQPAAPPRRRGGRAAGRAAVDAEGRAEVRQLVRREQAPPRQVDGGAGLRGPRRPQAAGRRALVRRRLRVLRPALAARLARDRPALPAPPASTSGSSTTASATRQRRPPRGRGRALGGARRGEHRHAGGGRVQPHRHLGPALAEHAAQRVPRPRRQLAGVHTTRRSCWS